MGTDVLFGGLDTTGSSDYFFSAGQIAVSPFTVAQSGSLERLKVALRASPDLTEVRGTVYVNSGGAPVALSGFCTTPAMGGPAPQTAVLTLDTPLDVTLGDVLWAGFKTDVDTCNTYGIGAHGFRGRNSITAGTAPNPFGSADFDVAAPSKGLAILGEGTAGGGGEDPGDDQFVRVGGVWVPCDRKARAGGAWI